MILLMRVLLPTDGKPMKPLSLCQHAEQGRVDGAWSDSHTGDTGSSYIEARSATTATRCWCEKFAFELRQLRLQLAWKYQWMPLPGPFRSYPSDTMWLCSFGSWTSDIKLVCDSVRALRSGNLTSYSTSLILSTVVAILVAFGRDRIGKSY